MDEEGVDFVLFYDGCKHGVEKSQDLFEQKGTYCWYAHANIAHFIGLTNEKGWFVEGGRRGGGAKKEARMVGKLISW
jgi:hypothetical protein